MICEAGIALIKRFEGFSERVYLCPAGYPTIGYGHVVQEGEGLSRISREEAEALLLRDLTRYAAAVGSLVRVPLSETQRAALTSFAFNLGSGNLKISTLRRKLNAGDYAGAAEEFPRWRYAGGRVLPGLVRRRAAERALFLS